jgi:hypothetical protein
MNGGFMREAIRLSVQTMRRGQGGAFGEGAMLIEPRSPASAEWATAPGG